MLLDQRGRVDDVRIVSRIIALVLLINFAFDVTDGIRRTPEKDRQLRRQRESWCSLKKVHSASYNLSDVEYFMEVCAPGQALEDQLRGRAVLGSRKEYRCMSSAERNGFHAALRSMKGNRAGLLSQYDALVRLHDGRAAPTAHFTPGFFVWHRIYLVAVERAVRQYCGNCMLPYWDCRLETYMGGNPRNSVLFSPQLAGNADGNVVTGFAANWPSPGPECRSISPNLYRFMDSNVNSFYDDNDVALLQNARRYTDISYPWSDAAEFSHGYVHTAFGTRSHMADIVCSPNDPMFFLHHCFVDNLFERSRQSLKSRGTLEYPNTNALPPGFPDPSGNIRIRSAGNAIVAPFPGNMDHRTALLSDDFTENIYDYERSPGDVACNNDAQCCANGNTEFIWCNTNIRKCLTKVVEGTSISRGFPGRACYCSNNRTPFNNNGVCACR